MKIAGFGISNKETFTAATKTSRGAIIGSAFIKMLSTEGLHGIGNFIKRIRG
jgi:tryptophan synthase alpha chain